MIELEEYTYNDVDHLKMRFKAILNPDFSEEKDENLKSRYIDEFNKICNYLSQHNFLVNGINPNNLNYLNFANTEIKTWTRQTYESSQGNDVKWADRRRYIDEHLNITS